MSGRVAVAVVSVLLAVAGTGCGSHSPTDASATIGARPRSTAKLSILSPHNGSVVHGSTIHIRLRLRHAHVVKPTSTELRPDEGHIHVLLDGSLVSMNYGLDDVIREVGPGPHLLQVEFVANDHAPFDPRVVEVSSFEVKT
jgi:hypothetical protein